MANIEFTIGAEQHSSNWGKYYVKGLEEWQCKEDSSRDKHQSYTEYQCNDIPEGTVFTIFEQSGNKRGTDTFVFTICITTDSIVQTDDSGYGQGKIAGNYRNIAQATGTTKAPRLMDWWISKPEGENPIEYAERCAEYIEKRGVKNLPPAETLYPVQVEPSDLELAVSKLIAKFGRDSVLSAIQSI